MLYELEGRTFFLFDRMSEERFVGFKYGLSAQVYLTVLPILLLIDRRVIRRALYHHRACLLLILLQPRRSIHKPIDIRLDHHRNLPKIILFIYFLNI